MRERILFVDDDTNLLESVQRNFRRQYECHTASSASQALEMMGEDEPFGIVVADMRMPGENGIGFLERSRKQFPDTVRIMLTGFADMETALDAINRGGVFSFLQKPFDTVDLNTVLAAASDEYRRLRSIHLDSLTDPLTGLYNRRFIEREFHRLLEVARRHQQSFSVIFGDVNGFKSVNDTLGHAKGDELLKRMADSMVETCRGSDLVCRFGGDEFLVVMESAEEQHAARLIERLQEAIGGISVGETTTFHPSISLGYATYPEDGSDIQELLQVADGRMYRQKSTAGGL
jgi:two-component system cell cycle response regulator